MYIFIVKVQCPVCGQVGYLVSEKRGNYRYNYVIHIYREDGKIRKRKHYVGKDTSELVREIEELIKPTAKKPISYAGGDTRIGDVLLSRINAACSDKCTFVEVFGGSGFVTQNVDRSKFANIIYNDIDDKLTTLFKVIKENPEKLSTLLFLLPYGRSIYKIAQELILSGNEKLGMLEAAALLFYRVNAAFLGKPSAGFAISIVPNSSEARKYRSRVRAILDLADRWKDVTIENKDFRDIIKQYDSDKTVFYLDPPYPDRSEEYYGTPFTVNDLREMAKMLTQIKGKFLLKLDEKTYSLIRDILPEGKYSVERMERTLNMDKRRGEKRRKWVLVLVSNYQSVDQIRMFFGA